MIRRALITCGRRDVGSVTTFLKVLQLLRLLRVLKVFRHYSDWRVLILALNNSWRRVATIFEPADGLLMAS